MPATQSMDLLTDEEIYRSRILIDDKPLRKLQRKFHALASDPDPTKAHTAFLSELSTLFQSLTHKTSLVPSSSDADTHAYERTLASISTDQSSTRSHLQSLSSELHQAQVERSNKVAYDAVASQMSALASRQASLDALERIQREIEELEQQSQSFKGTWERRKVAFQGVVSQLEGLGEEVREEKGVQERRQAMDEDQQDQDQEQEPDQQGEAQQEAAAEEQDGSLNPEAESFKPATGSTPGDIEDGEMQDS